MVVLDSVSGIGVGEVVVQPIVDDIRSIWVVEAQECVTSNEKGLSLFLQCPLSSAPNSMS